MTVNPPKVSVIIRNRDEGAFLEKVLLALSVQKGPKLELIIVDNASRDGSVEIAVRHGATVIHLRDGEFTYGKALNLGLAAARGEVCIILSAHSLPLGTSFVNACLAPFDNPNVAAARCVYAGKGSDLTRWAIPEVLDGSSTLDDIVSKGPLASGCALRRSVWAQIPFDEEVTSAEDKLWARRVVDAGFTIFSPCDAFYLYLKPISPSANVENNYRDLRAIFLATGTRLGAVKTGTADIIRHALWTMATAAPRSALLVIERELTRIRLRLAFPKQRQTHDLPPAKEAHCVVESAASPT